MQTTGHHRDSDILSDGPAKNLCLSAFSVWPGLSPRPLPLPESASQARCADARATISPTMETAGRTVDGAPPAWYWQQESGPDRGAVLHAHVVRAATGPATDTDGLEPTDEGRDAWHATWCTKNELTSGGTSCSELRSSRWESVPHRSTNVNMWNVSTWYRDVHPPSEWCGWNSDVIRFLLHVVVFQHRCMHVE